MHVCRTVISTILRSPLTASQHFFCAFSPFFEPYQELRAEHGGNIFRVFFIFDDGNVDISRIENGSVELGAGMFLRILSALGLRFEVSQPLAIG